MSTLLLSNVVHPPSCDIPRPLSSYVVTAIVAIGKLQSLYDLSFILRLMMILSTNLVAVFEGRAQDLSSTLASMFQRWRHDCTAVLPDHHAANRNLLECWSQDSRSLCLAPLGALHDVDPTGPS
jgi:hypothetical protein